MPRAIVIAVLLLAGACSHKPVSLDGCDLFGRSGAVTASAVAPAPELADYAATLRALGAPSETTPMLAPQAAAPPPSWLFLSGGGQNGAFGAGLLDRWAERGGGRLPAFQLVTGISTGALQGTFAFIDMPDRAVDAYTLDSEADVLDVRARGLVGQVQKGAAGTLDPLRRRLDDAFDSAPGANDDALLGRVAARAATAKFLVGVVEVRSGQARAIDMTALASRWAAPGADKTLLKRCYIEALVASSSEPLAAPPVYIDGEMFIDGGARFGVFREIENAAAAARGAAETPLSFVIVNGDLALSPQCPFKRADNKEPCPATGVLRDWDVLDLGFRSVGILKDQVYKFSVERLAAPPPSPPPARIENAAAHPFTFEDRKLTCGEWRDIDDADKPKPVQFQKRYMRCLIDYGRTRMDRLAWERIR